MTDDDYRKLATETLHRDGELEIDSDAAVSQGVENTGAYVQAWVWVANPTV